MRDGIRVRFVLPSSATDLPLYDTMTTCEHYQRPSVHSHPASFCHDHYGRASQYHHSPPSDVPLHPAGSGPQYDLNHGVTGGSVNDWLDSIYGFFPEAGASLRGRRHRGHGFTIPSQARSDYARSDSYANIHPGYDSELSGDAESEDDFVPAATFCKEQAYSTSPDRSGRRTTHVKQSYRRSQNAYGSEQENRSHRSPPLRKPFDEGRLTSDTYERGSAYHQSDQGYVDTAAGHRGTVGPDHRVSAPLKSDV